MKSALITASRSFLFFFLLAAAFPGVAAAETFSGTVIDVFCKDNDLATHPRACVLSCAKSGLGLRQANGKFLKFDEKGNARALAALKKGSKEQNLKAKVSGTVEGDTLKVESIRIEP